MNSISFAQEQQKNMLRCFGEDFVETLPARLKEYAALWQLSDFALIEYYSNNCLLTCHSANHGDCVLKIFGCEIDIYINEVRVLTEMKGNCRYVEAYEIDEKCGALLLERVSPGFTLKKEPEIDNRLSAFVSVWQDAHIVPRDPNLYESFLESIEKAAVEKWACGEILELRRAAGNMAIVCRDLYDRYPERLLLHCDLHGDNLLKNVYDEYTIVDPHGRIGPPVCDLGRYIANEYFDANADVRGELIDYIIKQLSEVLKLPRADVIRAFFVDITLMSCWGAEYGATIVDGALFAENMFREELR